MNSLINFIQNNIPTDLDPSVIAICLGILFIVFHDFYHLLFTAVFSWFKSGK